MCGPDLVPMIGMRMLRVSEPEIPSKWPEGRIKEITFGRRSEGEPVNDLVCSSPLSPPELQVPADVGQEGPHDLLGVQTETSGLPEGSDPDAANPDDIGEL